MAALKAVMESDILLGDHAELCCGLPGTQLEELVVIGDVCDVIVRVMASDMSRAVIVFTMVWKTSSEPWQKFYHAFRAGLLLEFASLDRKLNDATAHGIKGVFRLTEFVRTEGIGDAIRTRITATLERPGEWINPKKRKA